MPWSFDTKARRYRSGETGRFLAKAKVVAIRDAVVDAATREARGLAEQAARGEITADAFRAGMRTSIRNAHAAEFIFGRGGISSMTPADFGRLGQTLRQQYAHLDRFSLDIQAGTVSEAQAAARATMYVNGGTRSFEQGQAAAWGLTGQLPEYPGDSCEGMSNCRCGWRITETADAIEATWQLGGEDPCGPCQRNAANWNPYRMPKWTARPDASPVKLASIRRAA